MEPMRRSGTLAWLDDRLGLTPLAELARKKEVPSHRHSLWYYFGGMTLFQFVVQVVTGALLLALLPAKLRKGI
jgi:cytochrome b6